MIEIDGCNPVFLISIFPHGGINRNFMDKITKRFASAQHGNGRKQRKNPDCPIHYL